MPYCASCGHDVPPDAAFCGACGADVRGASRVCPVCGEQDDEAASFCSACGTPLVPGPTGERPGSVGDGPALSRGRRLALAIVVLVLAVLAAAAVAAAVLLRSDDAEPTTDRAPSNEVMSEPALPPSNDVQSTDESAGQSTSADLQQVSGSWTGTIHVEEECTYGGDWETSQKGTVPVDVTIYEDPRGDGSYGEVVIEVTGSLYARSAIVELEFNFDEVELVTEQRLTGPDTARAVMRLVVVSDWMSGSFEEDEPLSEGWTCWRGTIELTRVSGD